MGSTYLYGIMEAREEAILGLPGVDGTSPVHMVRHDGLGCVVSEYQGQGFMGLPREKLVGSLLAHQQVVERAMQDGPVLPAKFGTLLGSPLEAKLLLSQRDAELRKVLASLHGKMEVEVAATWDTDRVLREIRHEEAVVRLQETFTCPGQPSLEERIHLGQVVKACLDQRRESYRERMVSWLKPLAMGIAFNPLVAEAMVMNVAFLVDQALQKEFEERVRQLDQLFSGEIDFRVIGPLPPYSFCTAEIRRLTPGQVEGARQVLGLGEAFTEAEVRRAYRRLAARAQRELGSGDCLALEQFSRLRQASELLLQYCRARNGSRGDQPPPARLDSDALFVVILRGSKGEEVEPARFGAAERLQAL